MSTLTWNFALGDRMSSPAKGIATALEKVIGKLEKNDKAIAKVVQKNEALVDSVVKSDRAIGAVAQKHEKLSHVALKAKIQLDAERGAVDRVTSSLNKYKNAATARAHARQSLHDQFLTGPGTGKPMRGGTAVQRGVGTGPGRQALDGLGVGQYLGIAGAVGGTAYLAKQGFDAGLNLLVKGIQEASVKRNALSQMEMMGDSRAQAGTNYDWMMKLSDATAFDDKTVIGAVNKFRSAGFGLGETQTLMLGIADAAGTSAENAAEMVQQFLQIKSVGKVTLDNLNTFLERTGGIVGRDDIFDRVAKRKGIAPTKLDRENVTFDDFAAAFLDTVQEKLNRGGLIGTRSVKLGRETIEGQWEALKNNYDRLFRDIGVDPVVNMLGRLNTALTGAFGEEMKLGINKLFSDTFDSLFGKYQGAGGFDLLKDDLKQLGERALTFASALERIVVLAAKLADLGLGATRVGSDLVDVASGSDAQRGAAGSRLVGDLTRIPGLSSVAEALFDESTLSFLRGEPKTKLAAGGIVRRPTVALVGEAGPEAVVPLSGGRGMGGSPQITIVQHIAPGAGDLARQVAEETRRALAEALESLAMRAGAA